MELIDSVTNIPPHGSRIIALRSNFLRGQLLVSTLTMSTLFNVFSTP
jgi:hypothetical protein